MHRFGNYCHPEPEPRPHPRWGLPSRRRVAWLRVVGSEEADPPSASPPKSLKLIARAGKARLRELGPKLGDKARGQAIAIDTDSGDHFLGATVATAIRLARSKGAGAGLYVAVVGDAAPYRLHTPGQR